MENIAVKSRPKISAAEMERRKRIVAKADANNRIEGIFREPETDAVVELFVRGEIEATDLAMLFKEKYGTP